MYPDMVATSPATPTDGNPTKIYMVYYDQVLGQTKFRYGTVGAAANTMDYGLALNLDPTIANRDPQDRHGGRDRNEGTVDRADRPGPQRLPHSAASPTAATPTMW